MGLALAGAVATAGGRTKAHDEGFLLRLRLGVDIYVSSYRIYSDSQTGTSSCCHNKDIVDMNEMIELKHDIEGLEEILNLPHDILEALNRESEGYKRDRSG